eukprot:gene1393-6296_t
MAFDSTLGYPGEGPTKTKASGGAKSGRQRIMVNGKWTGRWTERSAAEKKAQSEAAAATYRRNAERLSRTTGDGVTAEVKVYASPECIGAAVEKHNGSKCGSQRLTLPCDCPLVQCLLPGKCVTGAYVSAAKKVEGQPERCISLCTEGISAQRTSFSVQVEAVLGARARVRVVRGSTSASPEIAKGTAKKVQRDLAQMLERLVEIDGGVTRLSGGVVRPACDQEAIQARRDEAAARIEANGGLPETTAQKMARYRKRDAQEQRRVQRVSCKPAKTLRLIQLNCCGVRARMLELRRLLCVYQPDVVVLQETHLTDTVDTPRFPGYDAVRTDRPSSCPGARTRGGLLTLVKEGLPWIQEEVKSVYPRPVDDATELQFVRIYPAGRVGSAAPRARAAGAPAPAVGAAGAAD